MCAHLLTMAVYLTPFLLIGVAAKIWIKHKGVELSDGVVVRDVGVLCEALSAAEKAHYGREKEELMHVLALLHRLNAGLCEHCWAEV
jgi:hypothetical protein